jgi:hypothetical protein
VFRLYLSCTLVNQVHPGGNSSCFQLLTCLLRYCRRWSSRSHRLLYAQEGLSSLLKDRRGIQSFLQVL